MNNFQTILSAIFLAFFVFAVLIFSGMIKVGDKARDAGLLKGKIVVWGTLSSPDLYKVFEEATGENKDLYISYIKKPASTYQQSLIEALATDTGPDLFFITPEMVIKNQPFFYKVPYESYPEKVYRDSFIEGAEVFLGQDGIIAFPTLVDPMVMYYNKNKLTNEGIAVPPVYWDELFSLNSKLTKKENNGTVKESMVALGRYDNVTNSKEILSTLLLQNGNQVIKKGGSKYFSVLGENPNNKEKSPAETILDFLIEFSNPSKLAYSWNRSLPNSFDMFISGKLAFYLGKASELFKIESTNPNLSFDVTQILQTKNTNKVTYGNIYAIAINKKSKSSSLAFQVAGLLSTSETIENLSKTLSLPPALKSLLTKRVEDPYMYTFYNSAIVARSWLDPDPASTNTIFNEMFNNILSNKLEVDAAISKAQSQITQTIK